MIPREKEISTRVLLELVVRLWQSRVPSSVRFSISEIASRSPPRAAGSLDRIHPGIHPGLPLEPSSLVPLVELITRDVAPFNCDKLHRSSRKIGLIRDILNSYRSATKITKKFVGSCPRVRLSIAQVAPATLGPFAKLLLSHALLAAIRKGNQTYISSDRQWTSNACRCAMSHAALEHDPHDSLSALETLRLGAAHAYYSISRALRLDKVSALLQRAELSLDAPVVLLGRTYTPRASPHGNGTGPGIDAEEAIFRRKVLAGFVLHFQSTFWLTYRTDFAPLVAGEGQLLRTDAGWGCTLRSMQMIVAQALQRQFLGRDWRWPTVERAESTDAGELHPPPADVTALLRLFWDVPNAGSPFSIHNLCRYGSTCGVFPGRWLGPWVGCRAVEAAATHAKTALAGHINFSVLGGSGGGAPFLFRDTYLSSFNVTPRAGNGKTPGEEGVACEGHSTENHLECGLVLLVPLVLGVGRLNPVYAPQLSAILAMPQSLGIVGGRPGSSLYFVGYQDESFLFLDPHQVQPAATSDELWTTFRCDVLRTLPLPSIDPSLALGFHCKDTAQYLDLCERLSQLEARYPGAPVVCVRPGRGRSQGEEASENDDTWADDELSSVEEEEHCVDDTIEAILPTTVPHGNDEGDTGLGLPDEVETLDSLEEPSLVISEGPEEHRTESGSPLQPASSTKSAWEFV